MGRQKLVQPQDTGAQPFRPGTYLACLGVSALAVFGAGLVVDNGLRMFDVGISPWREAMWSAIFSFLFSVPIAPILWRLGLVTLPQYLLGAMAVVVPLTILSALAMSQFYDIMIRVPGFDDDTPVSQVWVLTAYIRLARSALYVPIFLFTFWYSFHRVCNMAARR